MLRCILLSLLLLLSVSLTVPSFASQTKPVLLSVTDIIHVVVCDEEVVAYIIIYSDGEYIIVSTGQIAADTSLSNMMYQLFNDFYQGKIPGKDIAVPVLAIGGELCEVMHKDTVPDLDKRDKNKKVAI